jgi:5-formyltetrahydrofolate cyclo-ligase
MDRGMDGTKRLIRQEMRRRRRTLTAVELDAAERMVAASAAQLEEFRTASVILAYAATDHEVPCGALIEAAFAQSKRVFLPRLRGDRMSFAEYRRGTELRPGAMGIPEPLGDQLEVSAVAGALAFVPLVAWDATGSRVGRGGGHYDRAFTGPTRPQCLVGLGYTFQQHAALPRDPWDLRLDWVITEREAVRCRHGDDSSHMRREGAQNNGIPDDGVDRRRAGSPAGLGDRLPSTPTG